MHPRLVANLLTISAEKNLVLTRKLALLSRRTTREKLMAYFTDEARRAGSATFTLDYDRQPWPTTWGWTAAPCPPS